VVDAAVVPDYGEDVAAWVRAHLPHLRPALDAWEAVSGFLEQPWDAEVAFLEALRHEIAAQFGLTFEELGVTHHPMCRMAPVSEPAPAPPSAARIEHIEQQVTEFVAELNGIAGIDGTIV
jgi:hypothetical protein